MQNAINVQRDKIQNNVNIATQYDERQCYAIQCNAIQSRTMHDIVTQQNA